MKDRIREKNVYLETLKFFIYQYMYLYIFMLCTRVYFLYKTYPGTSKIPLLTMGKGFYFGWIFDNSIIGSYLVITGVSFIISIFLSFFKLKKISKYIYMLPSGILIGLICFTSIGDVEYFNEFGYHVNSTIVNYIGHTDEILGTVISGSNYHPIFNMILCLLSTGIIIKITLKKYNNYINNFQTNLKNIILLILSFLTITTFGVFSSRGGFSEAVLDWGRANYSDYSYANQFAINPIFSLGRSYYNMKKEEKKGATVKRTLNNKELKANIREYVGDEKAQYLSDVNPLLRITDTQNIEKKYNVVVVLMESFMSKYIGVQGAKIDLTPNFNKIAREGVFFDNLYATGTRSNRGIASVNVSFPAPRAIAVTKEFSTGQKQFYSLPRILKERGYNTSFIYGGDAQFDNMSGFLKFNGVEKVIDIQNFSEKDKSIKWGVPDDILFEKSINYMDKLPEPFYVNIFTLSNHAPYDIKDEFKKYTEKDAENYMRLNAFHFADKALGDFITEVKKKSWSKNTIFVFIADHGFKTDSNFELNQDRFKIPMLIWSPGDIVKQQLISKTASQMDLLPTVMHILGGKYKNAAWGRDLFKDQKENLAYIAQTNYYGVVDGDYLLIDGNGINPKLVDLKNKKYIKNIDKIKKLHKATRTYLELETIQLKQGKFSD